MKVMQVMPEFGLAGAETMCENLTISLINIGVDVVIVSFYDYHSVITERLEKFGVKIIYLNKKRGFDFSIYRKLRKLIKIEKPDVIHTHRYTPRYVFPASYFLKIKKRVHTVHNVAQKETSRIGKILNRIFFKVHKVIPVALSDTIQESISKVYRIKKDKIPVIFNGINLDKCKEKNDYSIKDKYTVLHIGRFMKQKNHEGLIDAFKLLKEEVPSAVLQLVGEGVLKHEIEDKVKENNLVDSVEFIGATDNVFDYLTRADVFVLSSFYEGVPMTLIEAMGTGIPIVATNVGGIPNMLTDEEAILTEVNPTSICNALLSFYKDENMRKTLGNNAIKKSKLFSSEEMAKQYHEIYCTKGVSDVEIK